MSAATAKAASVVARIKQTLQTLHDEQVDVFGSQAEEHMLWLREILPEVKRGLTECVQPDAHLALMGKAGVVECGMIGLAQRPVFQWRVLGGLDVHMVPTAQPLASVIALLASHPTHSLPSPQPLRQAIGQPSKNTIAQEKAPRCTQAQRGGK